MGLIERSKKGEILVAEMLVKVWTDASSRVYKENIRDLTLEEAKNRDFMPLR